MNNNFAIKVDALKKKAAGRWAEKILAQLEYGMNLSAVNEGKFDRLLEETISYLDGMVDAEGVITRSMAEKAESMILVMSAEAKRFKLICAAHAHIDMNWMWGFDETVAVTLDTFRTILSLMVEYPDFKFSQSQASVYQIVAEYDPEMLQEIKARVMEGRWEVTASTWVEADKNMPNGESLARHILYTKKYLAELLELDPNSLLLDFEPDTFGHNANMPEILSSGGVKYYYHCRGYDGHDLYRWQSPSGRSVITYREPFWYNAVIGPGSALHVPEFCNKHGLDTALKVYGVGDHGGGPTRRDLEKLIEMNTWPVFPTISCGTFTEYFKMVEKIVDRLPVVNQELNFIFSGCFTTQTRIKLANRVSEARLNEAEAFSALAAVFAGGKYPTAIFEEAWKKVLFNQFHDILPGSCVVESREYAMGQFQQTLAAANTQFGRAMRYIAANIDTSMLAVTEKDSRETNSEGAGVGYAISDYGVPQTERGRGKDRIIHFFNPSAHERQDPVEITIWDWPGDPSRLEIVDACGDQVRYQMLDPKPRMFFELGDYWGHKYISLLVDARVPAYGYSTYLLHEKDILNSTKPLETRVEVPESYVLENDRLKVVFDSVNASILSLREKKSGSEMLNSQRPAGIFRLIEEDGGKTGTAWKIGRYMNVYDLSHDVKIEKVLQDRDMLRQWLKYSIAFRSSRINVEISLDYNSARLDFMVECDWQENGATEKYIPQLNFHLPLGYHCEAYQYDIPFGTITRDGMDMDVPANSWALGIPQEKDRSAVMLVSGSHYGFRGVDNTLSLSLIRSSYDPDPYPETGWHKFRFSVVLAENCNNSYLIDSANDYNHAIRFISGSSHGGSLPASGSFLSRQSGSVAVSAVKAPEKAAGYGRILLRIYETEGSTTQAEFKFAENVTKAWYVDLNENAIETGLNIKVSGDTVICDLEANSIASLLVEFATNQTATTRR